ncbi:MAG: class I SAM-dependent methyltransferase [Pseudohongiella sp.]|uniref:class I SAM-dependent methyltransferase n=1 Tax=Pseudohongiella sp. TaxID=1979412 RepID=UPI0034A0AD5F
MNELAVQWDRGDDRGEQLAERLQLPLVSAPERHPGLLLSYEQHRLTLSLPSDRGAGSVCVDFTDARLLFRLAQPLSREAAVKAVGGCVSPQTGATAANRVIDATAGLGLDGLILAAAGWQVDLIEQSPVIHALLEDGLSRARQAVALRDQPSQNVRQMSSGLTGILERLHLCDPGDSAVVMPTLAPARVIYLDPMFPDRDKAARVKKNRYLLQQLHGAESIGSGLLPLALTLASKVVVKRPRLAECLDGIKPASSLNGKTSRFDIYVGAARELN